MTRTVDFAGRQDVEIFCVATRKITSGTNDSLCAHDVGDGLLVAATQLEKSTSTDSETLKKPNILTEKALNSDRTLVLKPGPGKQ